MLLGGVAADRLPRRALLIVVEAVRVVTALVVGLLAVNGLLQLWQLAVIAFVIGAAEAFFFPAYTALLPTMLPPDELLAANGVEGMLRPAAQQAVGPALAGLVVGVYAPGRRRCCWPASCTWSRCWPCWPCAAGPGRGRRRLGPRRARRGLPLPVPHRLAVRHAGLRQPVRAGADRPDRGAAAVRGARPGRRRAGDFALVLGAFGVGGAVGSLVISSLRMPRRYLTVMIMLWGAGAAPLALIGLTDQLWVMAAAAFVVGFTGRPRWSSGARCCSAGCPRTCSAGSPAWTSSSRWP